MQSILLAVHVLLAIGVIGLVLIQHGKGADAGAAFGSGASATVFGARGAGSFLTRLTTMCAALFFVTSLGLAYFAAQRPDTIGSVADEITIEQQDAAGSDSDLPAQPEQGEAGGADVPKVD